MTTVIARGERPRPQWLREHPRAWVLAVVAVCFGAFMGQLDASVVALTYHSIGQEFGAALTEVQWVSISYLLTLAILIVPVARLSDRYGRKRLYLWGFALFGLTSAGCALSPDLGTLVALRALQGASAALLQANSVALVTTSAPPGRRRFALGIQAAAQAVGLAAGPTVGGIVVQTVGWRWVFALNVPVAAVAVVLGTYLLPRTRLPSGAVRISLHAFVRLRGIGSGLPGSAIAYLLLFGPIVYVTTMLQTHGSTALRAGTVVAALPVGFAVAATFGERFVPPAWSTSTRCRIGLFIATTGLLGLLLPRSPAVLPAAALLLVGLGLGLYTPANNAAVMAAAPKDSAAMAGGLVSAARAIGTAAGTVLVATTLRLSGTLTVATLAGLGALAAVASVRRRRVSESGAKSV